MAEPNDPTERPSFERRPKRDPQTFRASRDDREDEEQPSKFARRAPQERASQEPEDQDTFFAKDIPAKEVNADLDESHEEDEAEVAAPRRAYQDFPELRTLRRWSILTRWYWRSCKNVLQFWDWDVQEGLQAMSNWRPSQRGLWRFSTMTGVISLLLTLLLFWQYKHDKTPAPIADAITASIPEETEPEILQTDSRETELAPPLRAAVKPSDEEALAFLDEGKKKIEAPPEEQPATEQPAATTPAASYNFDDEPVVEPKRPQFKAPQIEEPREEPKVEEPVKNEEAKKEEEVQSEVAEPVATKMPPTAEELEPKTEKKPMDPPAFPEKTEENKFEAPEETRILGRKNDEDFAPPMVKSNAATRVQPEEKKEPETKEPEKEEPVQSETVDPVTIQAPPKVEEKEEKPAEEPVLPNPKPREEPVEPEPVKPEPQPVKDVAPVREPAVFRPAKAAEMKVTISRSGSWLSAEANQSPRAQYSMTLKNESQTGLADLQVEETLPKGTKFVSAAQGGTYNPAAHSVTWKVPSIAAQGTTSLSVTVIPEIMTAQTSRVQVTADQGVVGRGSWTVTHSCPPTAAPPTTSWVAPPAYAYPSEIMEAVYEW